jgi:hypothetical protein
MRERMFKIGRSMRVGACLVAVGITVDAASGTKRTAEECKDDSECARGHCYQKRDGKKVCVDCSSSTISDFRGQIQRYCKDEPRGCTDIPRTVEVAEKYFTVRIENGDRCIAARKDENSRCWDGGDPGHKDAVDQAERARKNCYDELNTRKGNGGIYACSDSTYSSRAPDADNACDAVGRGDEWSKDDKVVNCRDIEDAMGKADKCVVAVERINSDCLPRLSRTRETQFARGKRTYDYYKDVLAYKKSKNLCK